MTKQSDLEKSKRGTVPIVMSLSDPEIKQLERKIKLLDEYNQLMERHNDNIEDRIIKEAALGNISSGEMTNMLMKMEVMKAEVALRQAMTGALVQYILNQQSLGTALKLALAQTLAQIAAEAAVRALFEAAFAIAAAAQRDFTAAASHAQAAAMYGAIGGIAGAAARNFAKSAGSGQGAQGSFSNPNYNAPGGSSSSALTGGPQQQGNTTYVYYINAIDTQTFSEYVKRNPGAITGVVAEDIRRRGAVQQSIRNNV